MIKKILLLILINLLISNKAFAVQEAPKPLATDKRFKTYIYNPYEVYSFTGHYNFQSIIEFAPEESIKTVSMGDPTGWQVLPSGNRIFIKPIDEFAKTNMSVITDQRIYYFEMYAKETENIRDDELVFVLKFVYPDNANAIIQEFYHNNGPDMSETDKYNFNYTISGPDSIAPLSIFDDGQFTYFQFKDINADLPAIFMVNSDTSESLINYRISGNYLVIERVTSRYTLRFGEEVVCVFNEDRPMQKKFKRPSRKLFGIIPMPSSLQ